MTVFEPAKKYSLRLWSPAIDLWLCSQFLGGIGHGCASCCASFRFGCPHTRWDVASGPRAGEHCSRLCSCCMGAAWSSWGCAHTSGWGGSQVNTKRTESTCLSSRSCFRLHKPEFKIVTFSQHRARVSEDEFSARCQQSYFNRCRAALLRIVSAVISPHKFSPRAFAMCLSALQKIVCMLRFFFFCRNRSGIFQRVSGACCSEAARSFKR